MPTGEAPSTDELGAWVKASLRSTKVPEVWEFRAELPKTMVGKVLRRALRDGDHT